MAARRKQSVKRKACAIAASQSRRIVGKRVNRPEGYGHKGHAAMNMHLKGLATAFGVGCALALAQPAAANTLRWSSNSDLLTVDPHSVNEPFTLGVLSNVMEPLLRYNEKDTLEGGLAERWELLEPTRWRFHMRKNVKFHDGTPFTADDAIFSIQRALSTKSDFRAALSAISKIDRIDDHTIEIALSTPYPVLPNTLASVLVMSKAWAAANGMSEPLDLKQPNANAGKLTALGTGPFRMKTFAPGTGISFDVNPAWWDKPRHNLNAVEFKPVASSATRVAALLTGELDLIYPLPLQDVTRVRNDPKFKVLERPSERTIYLGLDVERDELPGSDVKGRNPLKELRVRQAIYKAIDIDAIQTRIMRGHATKTGLLHAPTMQGFVPELNGRDPYDPDLAKKLLTEAGYPDGFSLTMNCPNDRYMNDAQICQAVVPMLARIGIKVDLVAEPRAQFFQKMQKRTVSFYLMGWGAATTRDAHNVISYVMHTPDGKQGSWNAGGFSNARVDQLADLIALESDNAKRQALIAEAFKLTKDAYAFIPLHQQHLVWAARADLDVIQSPDEILRFNFVRFAGK